MQVSDAVVKNAFRRRVGAFEEEIGKDCFGFCRYACEGFGVLGRGSCRGASLQVLIHTDAIPRLRLLDSKFPGYSVATPSDFSSRWGIR